MLKNFLSDINDSLDGYVEHKHPSVFKDPLALRIDWTSLQSKISLFKTHQLKLKQPNRLVFRPTLQFYFFSIITSGMGALLLYGLTIIFLEEKEYRDDAGVMLFWVMLFFSIIIFFKGLYAIYSGFRPHYLDKNSGFYFKGKQNICQLQKIYAIQLISRFIKSRRRNIFYRIFITRFHIRPNQFELIFVLEHGERIFISHYQKRSHAQADAKILSEFLGKPIWDATL